MKQTAVEWFSNEISEIIGRVPFSKEQEEKLIHTLEKAKEMEKQQSDHYAIEFLKWCESKSVFSQSVIHKPTYEKLLQQFKIEKKP